MRKNLFKRELALIYMLVVCNVSACTVIDVNDRLIQEDIEIMFAVIDKFSNPVPPPPLSHKMKDTLVAPSHIDSLEKIQLTIAVHQLLESKIDSTYLSKIPEEFVKMINTSLPVKTLKSTSEISSKNQHRIVLADTATLRKSNAFEDFDLLFHFSRIWYNEDKTKAICEVGVSRGKLNGFSMILCLKKNHDTWDFTKIIQASIW